MRNKENWNFANKLAGQLLLFISVVITLLSVLAAAVLKNIFSEASLLIWINLFLVLGLAWLIYTVEVRTKEFEQSAKDSQ